MSNNQNRLPCQIRPDGYVDPDIPRVYECIYPSKNIEVANPNPPQDFLDVVYNHFYNADPNSHETYVKWVSEQPTIWMNHVDTIRAASEGNCDHNRELRNLQTLMHVTK